MTTHSAARRRSATRLSVLVALTALLTGCIPMPTDATSQANAAAANIASTRYLTPGAYYLRSVDGRPVPIIVAGGVTLNTAYVVADTTERTVVGWGEGVAKGTTTSSRMGIGTARVLSQEPNGASTAVVSWGTSTASMDTVRWTPDSVVFARTTSTRSAAGMGRRLVYTRMVATDTL